MTYLVPRISSLWNDEESRDITAASAMRCRIDDREWGKWCEVGTRDGAPGTLLGNA